MTALLLIDIQNDFLPGGALAVQDGDKIIPIVNGIIGNYDCVVATQDWHPANHGSFAANNPGKDVYTQIELNGLPQTLWPVHCVQNTGGALFAPALNTRPITKVFPKGMDSEIDSYSGFFDNGHRKDTGLGTWLKEHKITALDIAGLATDYCVKFTVLDALQLGFEVRVLASACRGVNLTEGDVEKALEEMQVAGAQILI